MPKTSNRPSEVSSEAGEVHIQGPHGVDVSMTPAAAFETAQRLDAAAIDAILEGVRRPGDAVPGEIAKYDDAPSEDI